MAKSKSKARKRKQPARQSPTERLRRRLAQESPDGMQIVVEPEGQVRMSEVLEQFVEPYLQFAPTAPDRRLLFDIAGLAWNAALLPPGQEGKLVDEIMAAGSAGAAGPQRASVKEVVDTLIARKRALFADNNRFIVSVQVTETRDGFHLAVASTLVPRASKGVGE